MPRKYAKSKPSRRFTKRRGAVGKRSRFSSKKRFTKSTTTYTKVAGSTIGKNALVKLTYRKDFDASITSSNDLWGATPSTYGRTYPIAGEIASMAFLGSHCATPLGIPNSGATSPSQIAENYPLGLQNWGGFYDKAIAYGSSIRITMMPFTSTDTATRYVLLPIASQLDSDLMDVTRPMNSSGTTKAELDALDYPALCAYPGAKYGYVRASNAGTTVVKGFRKTKAMLGFKDIKDNQSALEMIIPDSNPELGNNTAGEAVQAWIWYFRVFAQGNNIAGSVQYLVQMKYYLQLLDRKPFTQALTTVV